MQPHSPLSTPHLLTPTLPQFLYTYPRPPHPDYFLYPHLLVSGNWLIHLFFVINLNFPAKYPSLESPHAAGQPSGPLWHIFETMRILCSVDKTFWPRKKRKRKRLKTVLASGDAFEQSTTFGKWEKFKVKGLSLTSQCRHEFSNARYYKMYTLPENHDWKPRQTNIAAHFMAKKDIKSDNFNGITSTTTGIRHFEHQQQWLKLENQSWKKNLRL